MNATIRPDKAPVFYPSRDGKPMAETGIHIHELISVRQDIQAHFAARNDVLVESNNFIYYEEGNPKACMSPDVYVVFGVSPHRRDSYKVWEEGGKVPSVVFELTSKSTKNEDIVKKKTLCAQLGVKEYFMFDPKHEYLRPPLQGFSLEHGFYTLLKADEKSAVFSPTLGLEFFIDKVRALRVRDPKTGEVFLRKDEADKELRRQARALNRHSRALHRAELAAAKEAEARRIAELAAAKEAEARRAADAEIARLKEELNRLRNG